MEDPRIVDSPHGGQHLHFNGFIYFKHEQKNGKTYWRCSLSRRAECNASAITQQRANHIDVLKEGKHQHTPDDSEQNNSDHDGHVDDNSDDDDVDEEIGSEASSHEETSDEDEESSRDEEWETWEEESDVEEDESENDYNKDDDVSYDSENMEGDEHDAYGLFRIQLKRYRVELHTLKEAKASLREAVFKSADKALICLLCEICWNTLRGNMKFSERDLNVLKPFRDYVRLLACEDTTWKEKGELLSQSAEDPFIPVLLNVVWPYL